MSADVPNAASPLPPEKAGAEPLVPPPHVFPLFAPVAPKLNYTTKETIILFGSVRLFQRLRFHRWLVPLIPGTHDALYPLKGILAAQQRLERGEFPPLLPSEIKAKQQRASARLLNLPTAN